MKLLASLALVSVLAVSSQAAPIFWTDWTAATAGNPGSATGTLATSGGPVAVSYSGNLTFAQTSGGTYYYTAPNGTSPYTSSTVDNAPGTSDIIAMTGGSGLTNTITFSQAVIDPVMAIVSMGQGGVPVTYNFDQDFTILSENQGYWGGTTTSFSQSGNSLVGVEAHGVIQFTGAVTSISFTAPTYEYWYGFTLGTAGIANAPSVPEPGSLALTALGLAALVGVARRKRKA
jgi:hypothetical protein